MCIAVSSYYGVIFPEFWTGRTGRELRERGGKDAQVLALYLATNRHANMLGLYRLMVEDIKHETGLGMKAIEKAFEATRAAEFATYDATSSFVWVHQMARFRLALKSGEPLKASDNRVDAVNRIYQALDPNPFLGRFYDAYKRTLHLRSAREPQGVVVPYQLSSPSKGALEPLISQITESENREQRTETDHARTERAPSPNKPAFERYHLRFMQRYGGKPTYAGGKDGARMSRLLKAHGLDDVLRRIDGFFDSRDPWIQNSGHTLDVFFAAGTQTKLVAEIGRNRRFAVSEDVWSLVLSRLEPTIVRHSFHTWFGSTALASDDGTHITVLVDDVSQAEWIQRHYRNELDTALTAVRPGVQLAFRPRNKAAAS